jgi:membrane associated rhomboid family serine protease
MRITIALVLICIATFIVQNIVSGFTELFSLTPAMALQGAYWQFFTYMFLHGGLLHIALNMFVLLMFGVPVEHSLGEKKYLFLYLLAGVGSAALYMFLTPEPTVLMLGASGAIFAVLTAYAFLYPNNLIFIPPGIPLPAKYGVILFAGLELFLGVTGLEPGIANFGHLGGIATGAALMLYWRHGKKGGRAKELQDYEFFWE